MTNGKGIWMRYVMQRCVLIMGLAVAFVVVPNASGQQPTPGKRLTQAMGFAETAQGEKGSGSFVRYRQ
jgi:hypothetical protein